MEYFGPTKKLKAVWHFDTKQDAYSIVMMNTYAPIKFKWLYNIVYKIWQFQYKGHRRTCTCDAWKIIQCWPRGATRVDPEFVKVVTEYSENLSNHIDQYIIDAILEINGRSV